MSGVRFSAGILNHFARNLSPESTHKKNIIVIVNKVVVLKKCTKKKHTSKKQSTHYLPLGVSHICVAAEIVVSCEASVNLFVDIKLVSLFRTSYTLS